MNILIASQCSKNALTETRRILDQFAERRGARTWQTPITFQGLKTLHKLLRQTARKNTAVACHWLRGKNHSELLWIVGDARRFNSCGTVPTNTTVRDILRSQDENDWRTAEEIRLLATLGGLFHDPGKANQAFQAKLSSRKPIADPYRHEWISLRLLQAFVGAQSDEAWLRQLAMELEGVDANWMEQLTRDGLEKRVWSPFKNLPPLATVVGWLLVSHHRIPSQPMNAPIHSAILRQLPISIEDLWCGPNFDASSKEIAACWSFPKGLPFRSKSWRYHVGRVAKKILSRPEMLSTVWLENPYVMHLARMALMLADHYYSSEPSHSRYGDPSFPLFANTDRQTGKTKQRLDEHLIGVAVNAGRIIQVLPNLQKYLPRIARHRGFRKRSKDAHYRWQDKAFDLAAAIQNRSSQQGFFGVNMASTGCGKTLANGRIMYALADQKLGVRFNIAIGLRTLTLQTGDAYRDRLGLGAEDLAVLVGGGSVRALHEFNNNMTSGSESERMLQPENQYVHFEGSLSDGPLNRWIQRSPDAQKLLNAPILVCTIDHLIPATESTRGGHQIAPMLRLLTSDLVLDEPDDFGIEDLPALARLVNWAGMLGCRVLLSSATLPPALIKGLFQAYLKGRYEYQRNRGIPGAPLNVCCAWFDEFGTASGDYATIASYELEHRAFVAKRLKKLASTETRRRAEIVPLPIARGQDRKTLYSDFAGYLYQYLHNLHAIHHNVDPLTDKRVSFGLIRMANIDPLVATTQALCALGAASDHHIYLCAYHSQHPLIVRSEIERHLDIVLNRTVSQNVFQEPIIRSLLDKNAEQNHIFIVIATAVAEVGRDHDYDWGIVEPSSMRSIIQLAGRIRRHRYGNCDAPNLYLLDTNLRHLRKGSKAPSFCRPGFETALFPLDSHHLNDLLTTEQVVSIDASSRISEPQNLDPRQNLVALEHERIKALMLGEQGGGQLKTIPVEWWWRTPASLSGELQRKQPFRHDPLGRQRYGLIPDDDNIPKFSRFEHDGTLTRVHDNLLHPMSIDRGSRLSFWGVPDYLNTLTGMADALEMDLDMCAHRFGVIDLPAKGVDQGWYYHPKLGFSRYQ